MKDRIRYTACLPCYQTVVLVVLSLSLTGLPANATAQVPPRTSAKSESTATSEAFRSELMRANQQALAIIASEPTKAELTRRRDAVEELGRLMAQRLRGQQPILRPLTKGQEGCDIMNACAALAATNAKEKEVRATMYRAVAGWMLQGKKLLEAGQDDERERARDIFGGIVEVLVGHLGDGDVAAGVAKAFLFQSIIGNNADIPDRNRRNKWTLQWCSMAFDVAKDVNGQLVVAILSARLGPTRNWRDSARIDLIEKLVANECWSEALILVQQVDPEGSLSRIQDLQPGLEKKAAAAVAEINEGKPEHADTTQRLLNELGE
jgi:hypothetical protein